MLRITIKPLLFLLLMLLLSCRMSSPYEAEVWPYSDDEYSLDNMPDFEIITHATLGSYGRLLPWNYEKLPQGTLRSYPLIVYLHGSGGAGSIPNGLGYMGAGSSSGAASFKRSYPCFALAPQNWTVDNTIQLIEEFKQRYPIDENRIYLIGYSMGGSGSYLLANGYYDFNQSLFAGIIRLAGQSQTSLREEAAQRTSVWLHIGLNDSATRVTVTREAYQFLKTKHPHASERQEASPLTSYNGSTLTLTLDNVEIVKKTEYQGVGHGVSNFPFNDPYLMEWLFDQSLEIRTGN